MYINTSDQEPMKMGFGDYICNWGLHICGLYETPQERDEILFGFFAQGIHDHDLNTYCPSGRTKEDFIEIFSAHHPECACHCTDEEYITFLSARELYYPDGTFSPQKMDENLQSFFDKSQRHGCRNVRASAEMVWAIEAIPGAKDLMAYESRLNYFIPGKPWASVCMYDINQFDGRTIMQVLQTHPFAINKGVITRNPFYMDPDLWLKANAPEFLPADR